jgi:2-polyprenyl-6-methoxyphenol hydroxylase-like FAD-dependent oxidoreductase
MIRTGTHRSALVVGGSIGGLIAALLLRRAGWQVSVCERSPVPLAGRGAGIVTHRELWDALFAAGIDPAMEDGAVVEDRVAFAQDGQEVARCHHRQIMTSWDRLFALVRESWGNDDYQLGRELVAIETSPNAVAGRFADGSVVEADLLIAADGFRSTVRQLLAPEVQPIYAGYVCWRGMVEEADLPADVHRELFETLGFCLPPGEQMVTYPVVGENHDTRPGHRRGNFVWYRPVEATRALPDLLTDATGHTHTLSIPPPLIRPEHIAALRAEAQRLLAPQFARYIAATRAPFLQPIYDFESERLDFSRVALVGDAAFQARPHIGAGVTKAGLDALALMKALDGTPDLASALAAYSDERVPEGKRVVRRARHLGAYMQGDDAQRHRSARAEIEETATLVF